MPKLVLHAHIVSTPDDGDTQQFPCAFFDELEFSSRLGTPILLANTAPGMEQSYIAVGKIKRFGTGPDGQTLVEVEKIRPFIYRIPMAPVLSGQRSISEISDSDFETIVASAVGAGFGEAVFAHHAATRRAIGQQLRRMQNSHCAFSDVATTDGEAFIIRPPEHGGQWHTTNALFLDKEPGALFTQFAWIVGPQFEIVIDSYAVKPDISDTVNRTGMLALNDTCLAPTTVFRPAAIDTHAPQHFRPAAHSVRRYVASATRSSSVQCDVDSVITSPIAPPSTSKPGVNPSLRVCTSVSTS